MLGIVRISGQAKAHDHILVHYNEREFERVPDLRWEDWTVS